MTQVCHPASLKGEQLNPAAPEGTEGEKATVTMDFAGLHQSPSVTPGGGPEMVGVTKYPRTDFNSVFEHHLN